MTSAQEDIEVLHERVDDVAKIAFRTRWGELQSQIPMSRIFVRPPSEGNYMAIEWRAKWSEAPEGDICNEVLGYLDEAHQNALVHESRQVTKTHLAQDIWADVKSFFKLKRPS